VDHTRIDDTLGEPPGAWQMSGPDSINWDVDEGDWRA